MGRLTSIMTEDLETCYICGSTPTAIHHAMHGTANRKLADHYRLIVGLCPPCHRKLHDEDAEMDKFIQVKAQTAFQKHYPNLNFREVFGKNYI